MNENSFALAASIWPKSSFSSEAAWVAYVTKWFPKLASMNAILAKK
jgi:hypothetical protein